MAAQEGGSIHEDGDAESKDGYARQVLPAGSVRREGGAEGRQTRSEGSNGGLWMGNLFHLNAMSMFSLYAFQSSMRLLVLTLK